MNMIIESLKQIYKRDLEKLRSEIEAYSGDEAVWKVEGGITNSAGSLCLHLVGNLNAYIGAELGKSGYVRQRDLEFSTRDTPRAELVEMIDKTHGVVAAGLDNVTPEQLDEVYPQEIFGGPMTTGYFLIHLAGHLNWHLGQINYHRRLLDR